MAGQIGISDLQRPFVWNRAKVRDPFDSRYRGYPRWIPTFLEDNVDSHAIGADNAPTVAPKMIRDGQQRLHKSLLSDEENADDQRRQRATTHSHRLQLAD